MGIRGRDAEVGPEAEDEATHVFEREAADEIKKLVSSETVLLWDPRRVLADVGRCIRCSDQYPAVEHHL